MDLKVRSFLSSYFKNIFMVTSFLILQPSRLQGREIPMCTGSRIGVSPNDGLDESVYLMKEFKQTHITGSASSRIAFLYGQWICPRILKENEATCPTYYTVNFDPARRPMTVVEARCSCSLCLSDKGKTTGRCLPIYYHRSVKELVKSKRTGQKCFRRVVKKFSVGCECIGSLTEKPLRKGSDM